MKCRAVHGTEPPDAKWLTDDTMLAEASGEIMAISEGLLGEFDHEMKTTRRMLERLPEGKADWKPHVKSMAMGRLAGHVAELVGFGTMIVQMDSMDMAQRPRDRKPTVAETPKQALEIFDQKVTEARAAIAGTSDEQWMKKWTLSMGEQKFYEGPRIGALRAMMMSHLIHHRAQLGVYYRMNEVPLPSTYGPSADEGPEPSKN
jgi:uncharacterized damage-inducible protein DinB